jgi:hypothetical protein
MTSCNRVACHYGPHTGWWLETCLSVFGSKPIILLGSFYQELLGPRATLFCRFPYAAQESMGSSVTWLPRFFQLQPWISGPDKSQNCVVVLAKYGRDQGQDGYRTGFQCVWLVNISLADLGFGKGQPNDASGWSIRRVLGGGGSGVLDHSDPPRRMRSSHIFLRSANPNHIRMTDMFPSRQKPSMKELSLQETEKLDIRPKYHAPIEALSCSH